MRRKTLAYVVYPGISLLELVANRTLLGGMMAHGTLLKFQAGYDVVVGGGAETLPALANADLIEYVRRAGQHAEWVAATSTGSLLLAAAGLLEGRLATTHWAYTDRLAASGARPQPYRPAGWVKDGKFTTSAGVSGAIDMALALGAQLTNQTLAKFGQLMIEYDPHPPFGLLDWSSFDEMQTALAPLLSQHLTTQEPAHLRYTLR